jgi:hypothetical protein
MTLPRKTIPELVEDLDRIREELMSLQRDLERIEPEETRTGRSPEPVK